MIFGRLFFFLSQARGLPSSHKIGDVIQQRNCYRQKISFAAKN
jgi:hypothetical protein